MVVSQSVMILRDENSIKWELAMKDEMDSLLGNQTWELIELPVGKKALHRSEEHTSELQSLP